MESLIDQNTEANKVVALHLSNVQRMPLASWAGMSSAKGLARALTTAETRELHNAR